MEQERKPNRSLRKSAKQCRKKNGGLQGRSGRCTRRKSSKEASRTAVRTFATNLKTEEKRNGTKTSKGGGKKRKNRKTQSKQQTKGTATSEKKSRDVQRKQPDSSMMGLPLIPFLKNGNSPVVEPVKVEGTAISETKPSDVQGEQPPSSMNCLPSIPSLENGCSPEVKPVRMEGIDITEKKPTDVQREQPDFSMMGLPSIPYMKNGCSPEVEPVRVEGVAKALSLRNTCAFDSICMVFVISYVQNVHVRDFIDSASESEQCEFFALVKRLALEKKVTSEEYLNRCAILLKYFEPKPLSYENYDILDCAYTAGELINKLFSHIPSCKEEYACPSGCENNQSFKIVYSKVGRNSLIGDGLGEDVKAYITCDAVKRCQKCESQLSKILTPGTLFFIETSDMTLTNQFKQFETSEIPTKLVIELDSKKISYELLGIVEEKISAEDAQVAYLGELDTIVHYIALCRWGEEWIKYDDMLSTQSKLDSKYKFLPSILVYVRVPE